MRRYVCELLIVVAAASWRFGGASAAHSDPWQSRLSPDTARDVPQDALLLSPDAMEPVPGMIFKGLLPLRHHGFRRHQADWSRRAPNEVEDDELLIDLRVLVEAWDIVRRAPLPGPDDSEPRAGELRHQGVSARLRGFVFSAHASEWYFLVMVLSVLIAVDLVILQHLPEIDRTHVGLLIFWSFVAVAFGTEVWLRLGSRAGISWVSGYLLEVIYMTPTVFVYHLIFCALETPRRLMRKALFVGIIVSILYRFAFLMGLAETMYQAAVLPYILGLWLIHCGVQQARVKSDDDDIVDVTQAQVVRILRWCLGGRLGEFYDEEGEAVFVQSYTHLVKQHCMTLLGATILCLLASDFLLAPAAALVRLDAIPNLYVNFSSSILAMFTVRALFFVVRDALLHTGLSRYGVGAVLFFTGAATIAARFVFVSALAVALAAAGVIAAAAACSTLRGLCAAPRAGAKLGAAGAVAV